jgi:hypothetical protein
MITKEPLKNDSPLPKDTNFTTNGKSNNDKKPPMVGKLGHSEATPPAATPVTIKKKMI